LVSFNQPEDSLKTPTILELVKIKPITSSFIKIANVKIKRDVKDFYLKPFILAGSKDVNKVYVLNQQNLKIEFIYEFTGM